MIEDSANFPFRRNTGIDPVRVPARDTPSKVTVPTFPEGVTSFGVDNAYPIFIRLVGTGYAKEGEPTPTFNEAGEGKSWIFGPGKHGPFTTQQPQFMSAVAVERPGFPIKDADGALLYPDAVLEVFYGSGSGGFGGSDMPFVNVRNLPAVQAVSGSVSLTGTPSVSVSNLPATQPVSGTVTANVTFPQTQQVSGTVDATQSGTWNVGLTGSLPAGSNALGSVSVTGSVNVNDANGSLTVDTGGPGIFAPTPASAAGFAITPVIAPAGSTGFVAKASPGNLYSASVVGPRDGPRFYLMALNRTTVPAANGAITAAETLGMADVPAGGMGSINPDELPDRHSVGIVIICSTSATTYTPPAQAPVHLKARFA